MSFSKTGSPSPSVSLAGLSAGCIIKPGYSK